MKQFQFLYHNSDELHRELYKIEQWRKSRVTSGVVFQILSESLDRSLLDSICDAIRTAMPDADYMGCSTNGNIFDGHLSETEVVVICTIFEYPTTRTELLQYHLTEQTNDAVTSDLLAKLAERPWVKAIELLVTIRGMSMTPFCDALQKAAPGINIFGGGAFSNDLDDNKACVFSKVGDYSENGVTVLLIGGEDFHVTTTHITGWKPLGKTFIVTRANRNILYELDGCPAYDVYYKYLNIRNDIHFFTNSLEFPFFYEHNGIRLLRAPTASNPDGSLVMTADMEENVRANLAYGDPWTILDEISRGSQEIREFRPEAIHIYSCAARRTFWGNDISKESMPFQNIAPTSGFYTSGEFLRTNGKMNQHNVTLVVAAMREGAPSAIVTQAPDQTQASCDGKVSMINRLATFIDAATRELEEANKKLAFVAVSDGLTKLYNRAEIQRRIKEQLLSGNPLSLVMLDIDNFKHVNDTYGHKEGDLVIIGLSDLLRNGLREHNPDASAGRWGGEEFMLLFPHELDYTVQVADKILHDFAALQFPAAGHQTISIGVTQAIPGEPLDNLLVRVDKALYEAKRSGKNRYVVL